MITRHQAEEHADQCLMYHAGLYAVGVAGLALMGSRSTSWIAAAWGLGLAAHAAALHAVPETREQILKWTAGRMEDQQRAQPPAKKSRQVLVEQ